MAEKTTSMKRKLLVTDIVVHAFLVIVSIVWLIPFVWIVAHSFRGESTGMYCKTFFPKQFTFDNYIGLFTDVSTMNFPKMFMNTFIIAIFTCLISTFFVLSVSYCLSRVKWTMRKPYMNMAMVINLFPGFMSMVAIYFLLKSMGLTEGSGIPIALVICFSAGAGTGFTVMKGYMDTIPKALDEAAMIDGCTRWQTFWKITLPLCKPMVVYQIITAFMGPWVDFIFVSVIMKDNYNMYTVALGLYQMLTRENIQQYFTEFCAGAVIIAIPITLLFIKMQKYYVGGVTAGGAKG